MAWGFGAVVVDIFSWRALLRGAEDLEMAAIWRVVRLRGDHAKEAKGAKGEDGASGFR